MRKRSRCLHGEAINALDLYEKYLGAAQALRQIAGIYYKQDDALSDDERIAMQIVIQMEEMIQTRMPSD